MFLLTLSLTLLKLTAGQDCPDSSPNWFLSGFSCYLISQQPLDWFGAQEVIRVSYDVMLRVLLLSTVGPWEDIWRSSALERRMSRWRITCTRDCSTG